MKTAWARRLAGCVGVAAVLAGCANPPVATPPASVSALPTAGATGLPSATPDPVAGWATYRSTDLPQVSFKHPPGWREDTSGSFTQNGQHIEDVRFVAPDSSVVEWDADVTGIGGACPSLPALPTVVKAQAPSAAAGGREVVDISAAGQVVDVGIMSPDAGRKVGERSCAEYLITKLGTTSIAFATAIQANPTDAPIPPTDLALIHLMMQSFTIAP